MDVSELKRRLANCSSEEQQQLILQEFKIHQLAQHLNCSFEVAKKFLEFEIRILELEKQLSTIKNHLS